MIFLVGAVTLSKTIYFKLKNMYPWMFFVVVFKKQNQLHLSFEYHTMTLISRTRLTSFVATGFERVFY